MLEDPSFFVALSFIGFCVVVYLWQGKAIRATLHEQIAMRLDPIHKAEHMFHSLSDAWHQAKHRMEQVTHDVQDIQHHYDGVLKQALEKATQREKIWMELREREMKDFQVFQQQRANEEALQEVLDEFIHESGKSV